MRALLGLFVVLAGSPAATAQTVPHIPHAVGTDGFLISLVHTSDRDAFFHAWIDGAQTLPITDHAVRGRPLIAVVIFQGCHAGPDGNCNLTGHFTYLRPDGSVYGELDTPVWTSGPARGDAARPSPWGPSLVVDAPDPMGIWMLRVRVTDHVRGVTVETEGQIVVDTAPAVRTP